MKPAYISRWLLITFFVSFAGFLHFNCSTGKEPAAETYASLNPDVKYVGMNSCRECHQSVYDSFIETGMGKSMDVASQSKSSAKFGKHHLVYDKHLDFWYYPYWQNDSLFIMEFRLQGKDTVHKRVEAVSYIVGSGQHTNSHLMNTEGYLNQMPLTFYTQKGKWDLPPGFENGGNSRFSRLIGLECMTCHNSYPVFEKGSENKYSFIDKGIGCERCHGPGEIHVRDKKAGKAVDVVNGIDYSIVNPAKLPIDLQLDVCQRCHIQGNAILNPGKSFFDFRPGMRLSDVMNVYMPVYRGHENEHIMASHVERMKLSKCFTVSVQRAHATGTGVLKPYKNALTCVTCHNPHVSVKSTGLDLFNNACKNCHTPVADGVCTEKKEIRALKNNNCVSCHMPRSGATDIPHVSVHDHLIRVPLKEEVIGKIREFVGINCINNASPDNKSKGSAFIAYFEKFNFGAEVLDSAKKYFPDSSAKDTRANFRELIHIAFLEKDYNRVIAYTATIDNPIVLLSNKTFDNADAWTSYRIGESHLQTGNSEKAEQFFSNAYMLAPLHHDFANKYASVLIMNNDYAQAETILNKSIAEYPKFPPALSNLGYLLLLSRNDTARASQLFDRALDLDPDYEQAIVNKAGLWMATGRDDQAVKLLSGFLKRHPGSMKVKAVLDQLVNN